MRKTRRIALIAAAVCAAVMITGCAGTGGGQGEITKLESSQAPEEFELMPDSSAVDDSDADSSSAAESTAEKKDDKKTDSKAEESSEAEPELTPEEQQAIWDELIEETVSGMSTEEKVGQLLMVRPDALDPNYTDTTVFNDEVSGITEINDSIKDSLKKYHVGGVVLYGKNVTDEKQLKKLNKDLQKASSVPLFIAANEEGGSKSVIAGSEGFEVKTYESMYSVGSSGEKKDAKAVGKTIGGYLSKVGINLDLAPVADVFSDQNNRIIGERAFSSDPRTASDLVGAMLEGLHEKGVMGTLKHFPGFGEVAGGTQWVMAISQKNWVELMQKELLPFVYNLKNTDMIMVGHVKLPKVIKSDLPASMSVELLGKLRTDLAYDGVIITDEMNGYIITSLYDSDKAAVMAVTAGADIVLSPYDLETAYNGLLAAVNDGTITEERLDSSVERIIRLKVENGLITPKEKKES